MQAYAPQNSLQSQEYPNRQYTLSQMLSHDGETIVYEGKLKDNENELNVAIKCYSKNQDSELEFIDWIISQQKQKQAGLIIEIYEKIQANEKTYIITEFSSLNLYNYLKQNQSLSKSDKVDMCAQTLEAILFLHNNQYFKGQIQSENFVLAGNIFKLANFGFKKFYQKADEHQKSIDIRSLGYLFYEISKGEKLLQGVTDLESDKHNDFNYDEIIPKVNDISWQQMSNLIIEMIQNKLHDISKVKEGLKNLKDQQSQAPSTYFNNYQQQVNSILEAPTDQFAKRYFVLSKLLGDGGEGAVYQARSVNETIYSTDVALKMQQKMKEGELKFIDFLIDYQKNTEQSAFQKSNLIRVYERFEYQQQQVLIMELGGKDMNSVLKKSQLTQLQKEQICLQIAQSIAFLHKYQIIHRDIKPENFIQVGSIFKLIDFGLVKQREQNLRQTKMVGSPQYQAPEIINGSDDYTASVDIWSLGCLFFEIFKESPLFNGLSIREVQQSIFNYCRNQQQVQFQIQQLPIREELKNLLSLMIDPIPHKRPNIDYVQKQFQLKFQSKSNLIMSTSNNQTGEQKTMAIFQTTHEIKFNEPKNNERQQKQNEILSKIDQNIKEYIELSFENCNQDCQKKIAEVQKNIKDVLIQHSLGQNNWNPSQKNPQFCQGPRLQVSNQIINNGKFPQSRNYTQQQTTNMNNFNSGQ